MMLRLTIRYLDKLRLVIIIFLQLPKSLILAAILLAGSWLSLDANARAAFFHRAREWYEDHIDYRFAGDADIKELTRYGISSLPAGYEEDEIQKVPGQAVVVYESNAGKRICFIYKKMESGKLTDIDTDNTTVSKVTMNQCSGELYLSQIQTQSSSIIWMDDKSGISFFIDAYADKQELIKMAESVALIDFTKIVLK